jgi:hypothetical protein
MVCDAEHQDSAPVIDRLVYRDLSVLRERWWKGQRVNSSLNPRRNLPSPKTEEEGVRVVQATRQLAGVP